MRSRRASGRQVEAVGVYHLGPGGDEVADELRLGAVAGVGLGQRPEATTIQRLQDAVAPAFALLAGMQLDLFTPMADAELTADELSVRLGVDANRLSRLLYALAATGLLAERDGRFRNGREAAEFLVTGRPRYMGGSRSPCLDLVGEPAYRQVHPNWQASRPA